MASWRKRCPSSSPRRRPAPKRHERYRRHRTRLPCPLANRGCKPAAIPSINISRRLQIYRRHAAVLPRTSSSTSGFFLCGMMLEPVQKASGSSRKLNSVVDHKIHSSAQPPRCNATSVRSKTNSRTKSRSLDTSRLFAATLSKPKLPGHAFPVNGDGRARQGRSAKGEDVDALAAIGQTLTVAARTFLDVGQEIMGRQKTG